MQRTKTEKIADAIQAKIASGKYTDKLPSEQDLAKHFATTPVTAGKALNLLRDRSVIVRVPRLGSFVNKDKERPVKCLLGGAFIAPEFIERLQKILKSRFPQREIVLDTRVPENGENPFEADYDIIKTVATFRLSYSKYIKPLPSSFVAEYKECGKYFESAIDIHRDHQLYYGLPILASPVVMFCNRDLLKRYMKIDSPYDFTMDMFRELSSRVWKDKDVYLVDGVFKDSLMRYFVFSGEGAEGKGESVSIHDLRLRLRDFWKQAGDCYMNHPDADFLNGNVLFRLGCRQSIKYLKDVPFKWDVLPMPLLSGVRAVPATGEFLMISNRASDPAAALEVCKAFLEPQVQKLIAEYKFGLPVLKSLIPDTMDTRRYRDDIFVSEMKDLLVNNALDQDVNLSLVALMYGLLENAFNFEEFLDQAERLFQMHYNMRSAEDRIHSQLSWSY